MSVVSSRVSSVASILRATGIRSKYIGQINKVHFKLPKDVRNVLINYENGHDYKIYEDLVNAIKDSYIKDNELIEFLTEIRQCISLLGPIHIPLIQILLSINWTHRSVTFTIAYKGFLEDLVCAHIYHSKLIIDKLVNQFKPEDDQTAEWEDGKAKEKDLQKFNNVHDVLRKFLKIIPMSSELLLQSLTTMYPYMKRDTHSHELYVHALLQIVEYAPQLRSDILSLIINRLIVLDVNAPLSEIKNFEDEEMEEDENNDGVIFKIDDTSRNEQKNRTQRIKHPIAHTLDVCMEQVLAYIHNSCHIQGILELESLKSLYHDILQIFEKIILPTHASNHVQFILFYICSFKTSVAEAFMNWLWRKVSNPNVAPVIRQSSIFYIASLLARSTFIPLGLLKTMLSEMLSWIHSYISAQDSLECANSDVRVHTVFYAVCQASFYIIAFKYKDLVETKRDMLFLQSLNLTKIVTCRLNPLRVCQPVVVQNFAAVTRTYQLAYCYTVIEHNTRSSLPVVQNSNRLTTWLDTFFPFDPYVLGRSGIRITPLYAHYQDAMNMESNIMNDKDENDEDDFMDESFSQLSNACNYADKFSYSTSPGFIHTP